MPVAAIFLPPLLCVELTLGLATFAVSFACTALAPLAGADGALAGLAVTPASLWKNAITSVTPWTWMSAEPSAAVVSSTRAAFCCVACSI